MESKTELQWRVPEERLAMPTASESRASLAALLAADFREFGSSGRIYGAATTLAALTAGGASPPGAAQFVAVLVQGAVAVAVS